jgi:hypothetical protein
VKFAYADPPYYTLGKKLYGKFHAQAADWDSKGKHLELIQKLINEYPDGWALSCNPANLQWMLPAVPEKARVCAWIKPFHQIRKVSVQYAWEAVILFGGREDKKKNPMVRDWLSCVPTLMKGLPGAKPDKFNDCVLDLLNFKNGDTIEDLFPGTNGMQAAADRLKIWSEQ